MIRTAGSLSVNDIGRRFSFPTEAVVGKLNKVDVQVEGTLREVTHRNDGTTTITVAWPEIYHMNDEVILNSSTQIIDETEAEGTQPPETAKLLLFIRGLQQMIDFWKVDPQSRVLINGEPLVNYSIENGEVDLRTWEQERVRQMKIELDLRKDPM